MRSTLACVLLVFPVMAWGDDKPQMIGGKSEILRYFPKKFATLNQVDVTKRQVTLLVEGEKEPATWTVNPDAEVKVRGFWGRLDQFTPGSRVWVWFDLTRQQKPKSILMLSDELSQLDIHGTAWTLLTADADKLTVEMKPPKGDIKTLKLAENLCVELEKTSAQGGTKNAGTEVLLATALKPGQKYFIQTGGDTLHAIVDQAGLGRLRDKQRMALRERWTSEGLPGTVTFLHPLSGEMELTLDHEAMRWARNLKTGDKVTIKVGDLIKADVKEVKPWRERTVLRLVVEGFDQADLTVGERVALLVHVPPLEIDTAELPPDIGRKRTKEERCEWFLCSIYCSCAVANEICTGQFYVLGSCNVNACGMPNYVREEVATMIDKGLTDQQIWAELKKNQGPLMLKQHLLP